jgi:hypothetical protein
MSVDLVHPAVEKVTLVLEGIGAGKVRVNSASLDHPVVILAGEALEIVGIEKKVMMGRVARSAYWLNHDPSGLTEAGLRAGDKVTVSHRNATCDGRGCDVRRVSAICNFSHSPFKAASVQRMLAQ